MSELKLVLNRPAEAYALKPKPWRWLLPALTALCAVYMEPLMSLVSERQSGDGLSPRMLWLPLAGALTYFAFCLCLYGVCRLFGSRLSYAEHLGAWGLSYPPTLICALAVAFGESFFYFFWQSSWLGVAFSVLFIGLLLWKALLYLCYLSRYAGLRGWRLAGAFALGGVCVLALAWLDGYIGLKTPML